MSRYVANHIRFAVVKSVNYEQGIVQIRWLDNAAEDGQEIPIPHPFAGRGEGIYTGIRPGTLVAVDMTSYERYVPVAVLPMRGFYTEELGALDETQFDDVEYPFLEAGEIVIQGATGDQLRFKPEGGIGLLNRFGEGTILGGDLDDAHRCVIVTQPPAGYEVSAAGLSATGLVRRDARPDEGDFDTAVMDPMFDLEYEQLLEEIGRDPSKDITYGTRKPETGQSGSLGDQFRNPPFTEKRSILYEFGTDWLVDEGEEEDTLMKSDGIKVRAPDDRRERRTNVMSLTLLQPNELMEQVEGTLVDIFGNLLDINRNVILPPVGKTPKEVLLSAIENARHTVAFHKEINTRKGWGYRKTQKQGSNAPKQQAPGAPIQPGLPDASSSANNARDRSRWFIDVDKEGLTKINIPATSETGTVPFLTRHESSSSVKVDAKGNAKKDSRTSEEAKRLYRSDPAEGQPRRDVFLDQFGPGGIAVAQRQPTTKSGDVNAVETLPDNRLKGELTSYVEDSTTWLPNKVQAGTAFHDITKTANLLIQKSLNKQSDDAAKEKPPTPAAGEPAVYGTLLRTVPSGSEGAVKRDAAGRITNYPNAGGRSVHLSLDGSLETSIGANTIDRVSWIMDTAGGVVMRLGRDREGRSAIVHTDGTIALEVGGYDFIGSLSSDKVDTRFVGGGVGRNGTALKPGGLQKDPQEFRTGKVVIRVRRDEPDADSVDDQLIIIDENGISIEANGQMTLSASQTLVLKSDSKIVLDTKLIQLYGKDDPRYVIKNGNPII